MTTHDLRRRLHVLGEFGLLGGMMGSEAVHSGSSRVGGDAQSTTPRHTGDTHLSRRAESVYARSLFCPPWRVRLADGTLGPWYGPTTPQHWHDAWKRWRQSRAGGALWDEETAWRSRPHRPAPQSESAPTFLEPEDFLARFGHQLTPTELKVATLYLRDRLKPHVIRHRVGLKPCDVQAVLRSVIQKWSAAAPRRSA